MWGPLCVVCASGWWARCECVVLCVCLECAGVVGFSILAVYLAHAFLEVRVFVVHASEVYGLVGEDVDEWIEVFSARIYREQSGEASASGMGAYCVGYGSSQGGECGFRYVGGFGGVKGFAQYGSANDFCFFLYG